MTHDSLIRSQSGRMSPAALALAIGLHGLAAAALWWAAPLRSLDHAETPIMVSVEAEPLSAGNLAAAGPVAAESVQAETGPSPTAPAEAEKTPAPSQQAALAPAAPVPPVPPEPPLREPVPVEKPTAAETLQPPLSNPSTSSAAPPAPSNEPIAQPAPPHSPQSSPAEAAAAASEPLAEAETETAWQTDVSSWKPQVTVEPSLAAPPPRPVRPAARPPTAPRTAQAPGQRLQDYPPQTSSLGGPSTSSFDQAMGDGGARNDYLSRVYRHIDPHRDYPAAARAARQHGRVVTRVTINRSGELLDMRLDRSSGWPLLDNAEMAAIRRAMPLPPVPAGMRGDPIVLVLPMNY